MLNRQIENFFSADKFLQRNFTETTIENSRFKNVTIGYRRPHNRNIEKKFIID